MVPAEEEEAVPAKPKQDIVPFCQYEYDENDQCPEIGCLHYICLPGMYRNVNF